MGKGVLIMSYFFFISIFFFAYVSSDMTLLEKENIRCLFNDILTRINRLFKTQKYSEGDAAESIRYQKLHGGQRHANLP